MLELGLKILGHYEDDLVLSHGVTLLTEQYASAVVLLPFKLSRFAVSGFTLGWARETPTAKPTFYSQTQDT
jgi:hypothetical protein